MPNVRGDMDREVKEAMDRGGLADITTTGARTGQQRRIEIAFHQIDDHYYLTGRPGFVPRPTPSATLPYSAS